MLLLKDYFTQQGYNFDSWSVQNSAEDNYQMLNTSANIGAIIINEEQLIFTIDENNQIVYISPEYTGAANSSVIKVLSYSDLEVLDILFSNCPDDLKLSTDELKNMADSIVLQDKKIQKNQELNILFLLETTINRSLCSIQYKNVN